MPRTIEKGIVAELRAARAEVDRLALELERLREDTRYVAHRARRLLRASDRACSLATGHALDVLVDAARVDEKRIIEPGGVWRWADRDYRRIADDIERAQEDDE